MGLSHARLLPLLPQGYNIRVLNAERKVKGQEGRNGWADEMGEHYGEMRAFFDSQVALFCTLAPVTLALAASMKFLHLSPWTLCALGESERRKRKEDVREEGREGRRARGRK